MIEQTVTYNGATITLKRATVRSRMLSQVILGRLGVTRDTPNLDFYLINEYANFLTQTKIEGDVGFHVPLPVAESDELKAGYEVFYDAPSAFFDAVVIPLRLIESDVNDDALLPKTDEEKKI